MAALGVIGNAFETARDGADSLGPGLERVEGAAPVQPESTDAAVGGHGDADVGDGLVRQNVLAAVVVLPVRLQLPGGGGGVTCRSTTGTWANKGRRGK